MLSCLLVSEIVPHAFQHDASVERLGQHLVDECAVRWHELGQRPRQVVGDGQLGGDGAGEVVGVGLNVEWLVRQRHGGGRRRKVHIASGQSADRKIELVGQRADAVGASCDFCRAQLLFAVQPLDLGGIHRRLASMVNTAHLGGGDALKLALTPEVGFEFSEHAQHV